MRYLGNKSRLVDFIEEIIIKYNIDGETFADLFSGTGSVGDYFKDKYKIISNDYLYFCSIIAKAKLLNKQTPLFDNFKKIYSCTPFEWLNNKNYIPNKLFYIYQTYSPIGDRMYFTKENSIKIDGIRMDIEYLYKENIVNYNEYVFLLSSLIESVLKISNTSGTFQAFFKFWESRSTKPLILKPLTLKEVDIKLKENMIFNKNTNDLIKDIFGDIAYIDPPYTITQYSSAYHVLETIAKYDYPSVKGKTGRRNDRVFSNYSKKKKALLEFEDLFSNLNFKHILMSYSNQSLLSIEDIVSLAKQYAKNNIVFIESKDYREYSTNNFSLKRKDEVLKEYIIYFQKNI